MAAIDIASIGAGLSYAQRVRDIGRVSSVEGNLVRVLGLGAVCRIGDLVRVWRREGPVLTGEIIQLHGEEVTMLPDMPPDGVSIGDRVALRSRTGIAPTDGWIGRIVDPFGQPLDGAPLLPGSESRELKASPPPPAQRRGLGDRIETGMTTFNTMLPVVRGQRLGLFAGSGVGKSSLMGRFARQVQADVAVIALIGERGRELREFVENVLGKEGLARSVVIAATSDQSPLVRRRCVRAAKVTAILPPFSAFWWQGRIWMNRLPTSCVAYWMGMWFSTAKSPREAGFPRSIFCGRCPGAFLLPQQTGKMP